MKTTPELGLREIAVHWNPDGSIALWGRLTPGEAGTTGCVHDGSVVRAEFRYSFDSMRGNRARYEVLSRGGSPGHRQRPVLKRSWRADERKACDEMIRLAIAQYEEIRAQAAAAA